MTEKLLEECPICESKDIVQIKPKRKDSTIVYKCNKCGMEITNNEDYKWKYVKQNSKG